MKPAGINACLTRALAVKPGLLLDEPLAAVDVRAQAEMGREPSEAIRAAGIPCIVFTHADAHALEPDRICVMEEGRVVIEGTIGHAYRQSGPSRCTHRSLA